jgi:hypothetical protein
MKVEIFSDKFVTKANRNGRAVIDTDDPKARKVLGAALIEEILGRRAEEDAQARSAEPKKRGGVRSRTR